MMDQRAAAAFWRAAPAEAGFKLFFTSSPLPRDSILPFPYPRALANFCLHGKSHPWPEMPLFTGDPPKKLH